MCFYYDTKSNKTKIKGINATIKIHIKKNKFQDTTIQILAVWTYF